MVSLYVYVCGNNFLEKNKFCFKPKIYKISEIVTHLTSKVSQILSFIGKNNH